MRTRHPLATARCCGWGTMRRVKSPLNGETTAGDDRYQCWVRRVGLALAVCLVMALSSAAPARASTAELVRQLDGLIGSFPGGAGIWVADPNIATPLYAHDPEDNWATPHAIGTFFTLLAKRQLISAGASDRMLSRLERQQINDRLPAQLPPGVVIAHKTGNLGGVMHDAGIVYTKTGPRVVAAIACDATVADALTLLH